MKTNEQKTAEIIATEKKLNEDISKHIPNGYGGGYYYKKSVVELLEESNAHDFDADLMSIKMHYLVKVFYDNQPSFIVDFFDWKYIGMNRLYFFSENRDYFDYDLELDLGTETLELINDMEKHFLEVEKCFECVNNEYQIKVA